MTPGSPESSVLGPLRLVAPILLPQLLSWLLVVVDLAMVGHLGKAELAIAALALAVWSSLHHLWLAAAAALDTFLGRSCGGLSGVASGLLSGGGTAALGFLFAGLLALAKPILLLLGQETELATGAGDFCRWLIAGVMPFVLYQTVARNAQVLGVALPGIALGVATNVLNVVVNWLLIYKFGLGITGAPLATSFSRWAQCAGLILYVAFFEPTDAPAEADVAVEVGGLLQPVTVSPPKPSSRCECAPLLWKFGLPGAGLFGFEVLSFELLLIISGLLGAEALCAQAALLGFTALSFISGPFGLGLAAPVYMCNLLGLGHGASARSVARSLTGMALLHTTGTAILLIMLRWQLGSIFTQDPDVAAAIASAAPAAAVFQVINGLRAILAGLLRGLGQQVYVIEMDVAGWVIGVVLGVVLAFQADAGVAGLWWGLVLGFWGMVGGAMALLLRTDWEQQARAVQMRAKTAPDGKHHPIQGGKDYTNTLTTVIGAPVKANVASSEDYARKFVSVSEAIVEATPSEKGSIRYETSQGEKRFGKACCICLVPMR